MCTATRATSWLFGSTWTACASKARATSWIICRCQSGRRSCQSWYKETDLEDINYYPSTLPAKMAFSTGDPKREFIELVVNRHILPATNIAFDRLNYLPAGADYPPLPKKYQTRDDYMQGFRAVAKPGTPFFSLINDSNANTAFMRIRVKGGTDVAGTIVINRWHDSVALSDGRGQKVGPHPEIAPTSYRDSSMIPRTISLMSARRTCRTFLIC